MRFPLFVCPIQVVAIVVLHVFCLLRLQSFQSSQDQIDTSRWSIGRLSLHQIEMIRASATFCSGPAPMSHTTLEGEVRQHDFFRGGQHSSNSSSRPSGSAAPCLPLTVTLGQTRQVAMSDIDPPPPAPPLPCCPTPGFWLVSLQAHAASHGLFCVSCFTELSTVGLRARTPRRGW